MCLTTNVGANSKVRVFCARGEMHVGSKAWGGKKKHYQQCWLSSFKTISTTHLAQGPLKTHNIKHRYRIYSTENKEKEKHWPLFAPYAVQLLCQLEEITCCHLLSVQNSKMLNLCGADACGWLHWSMTRRWILRHVVPYCPVWPWKCFSFGFTQRYLPASYIFGKFCFLSLDILSYAGAIVFTMAELVPVVTGF